MKICIITQALRTNYGGLLQAYALQRTLRGMGHDVTTDRFSAANHQLPLPKRIWKFWVNFILLKFFGRKDCRPYRYLFTKKERKISAEGARMNSFVDKHIVTCDFFGGRSKPKRSMLKKFDAIVSGSDQVWRPRYSNVPTYMLDFAKNSTMKKIVYAASFGVDSMDEFSGDLLAKCSAAAANLDAVSVRESSGVRLCRDYLGVEAKHVLDPTLLLTKEDYEELSACVKSIPRGLSSYILDPSEENFTATRTISRALNIKVSPLKTEREAGTLPTVEEWLSAFRDSEFIVTDSFHGTVFSIIFQKPFVTIINDDRGAARFHSLLKVFGLEDRMIRNIEEINLDNKIDYARVATILEEKRKESLNFLLSLHLR